jgi:hypothetical protein
MNHDETIPRFASPWFAAHKRHGPFVIQNIFVLVYLHWFTDTNSAMPSACPLGYPTAKLIFDKKKILQG